MYMYVWKSRKPWWVEPRVKHCLTITFYLTQTLLTKVHLPRWYRNCIWTLLAECQSEMWRITRLTWWGAYTYILVDTYRHLDAHVPKHIRCSIGVSRFIVGAAGVETVVISLVDHAESKAQKKSAHAFNQLIDIYTMFSYIKMKLKKKNERFLIFFVSAVERRTGVKRLHGIALFLLMRFQSFTHVYYACIDLHGITRSTYINTY